jgi:hypothetical protein
MSEAYKQDGPWKCNLADCHDPAQHWHTTTDYINRLAALETANRLLTKELERARERFDYEKFTIEDPRPCYCEYMDPATSPRPDNPAAGLILGNLCVWCAHKKAEAFKAWTHAYLDKKGVPSVIEDEHLVAGCRIGGRMDWVFAKIAELERAIEAIRDKWVPALLRDCREADKTDCNAQSIYGVCVRALTPAPQIAGEAKCDDEKCSCRSLPPAPAPSAAEGKRIVEIVGTDGKVHYRRPEGDPMIDEAKRTPGYSVRFQDAAEGKPCGCNVSTAIDGGLSYGTGDLDENGFWSVPCLHRKPADGREEKAEREGRL